MTTEDAEALDPTTPSAPLIVGHRGAAAVEPENTVRSFRRGVADGADLLECDVHLSADGHDVIMHDATIDRTAQEDSPLRSGAIADLTRAELDRVLVGEGEHVPTLRQVLEAAVREDGTRVPVLVEVKARAAASLAVRILLDHFGEDAWADPQDVPAHVISFHADALRTVREEAPRIPLMLTTKGTTREFFAAAAALGAEQLGVRIADVRFGDVATTRHLGARLNLWTARSEEQLARAVDLGCDTVTVDDPAWARELLEKGT